MFRGDVLRSSLFGLTLAALITFNVAMSEHLSSVPPLVTDGPAPGVVYKAGQSVVLRCMASGQPEPRYEWFRNGTLISPGSMPRHSVKSTPDGASVLAIWTESGQSHDRYQCKARNEAGTGFSNETVLQEALLQIIGKRRHQHHVTNHNVYEGRQVVLPCNHTHSVPRATVTWYTVGCARGCNDRRRVKLNERIAIDDNGGLVFSYVLMEDALDDRIYKCNVFNPVLLTSSGGSYARIVLESIYKDISSIPSLIFATPGHTIVTVGNGVILRCIFSGWPLATIVWTKGGLPMEPPSGSPQHEFHIRHAQYSDSGYYECRGQNDLGKSGRTRIRLRVQSKPEAVLRPTSQAINPGDTAVFKCSGKGTPRPEIKWFLNDLRLNETNDAVRWKMTKRRRTLTLYNLKPLATMSIHCVLENKHGYVILPATLRVTAQRKSTETTTETMSSTVINKKRIEQNYGVTSAPPVGNFTYYYKSTIISTQISGNGDHNLVNTTQMLGILRSITYNDSLTTALPNRSYVTHILDSSTATIMEGESSTQWQTHMLGNILRSRTQITIVVLVALLVVLLPIIVCVVCAVVSRRYNSYAVGKQEDRHGRDSTVDYDSDDSGYDDEKNEEKIKLKQRDEQHMESEDESIV